MLTVEAGRKVSLNFESLLKQKSGYKVVAETALQMLQDFGLIHKYKVNSKCHNFSVKC
jgi:hypothetical protein